MKRKGWIGLLLIFALAGCGGRNTPSKEEIEMKLQVLVNGHTLTATLEENASGRAFYELAKEELTLSLSEYGGFEKVGPIGKTLLSNDKRITAKPGDLILYNGNQLSLFYGSNTWSYSKLGSIDHVDTIDLASILGDGDVTVIFTI